MEEINTIFSDDHSFFQEAMMRKGPTKLSSQHDDDDDDVEDFENDPSIYDPPSKICGGAVFSKLRSFKSGKNNINNKTSDENFDKKQKKKVQYNPQVNENSPKLINKLTDKMKKRKTKKSDRMEIESFKQSVLMQDSTTLSSISNPSLSSSPWVTEDDVDDYFDRQKREIMGESTQKYTNQSSSGNENDTNHSRQTLQGLLNEMKNLNGIVKENSNTLQKGIENIAFELEQENNMPTPQTPNEKDNSEMEQLRQERSYYRTEAETLRMEMKDIKEQLSEIRKILPQMGKSFDIPAPPKSVASTTVVSSEASDSMIIPMYMGEAIESVKSSEEHAGFLETIDYPPLKDQNLSFRSEVREILSDSERRVADSEQRARSAIRRRAMKNAKAIIQQHHNQPIRTNDDVEEEKSFGAPPTPKAPVRERSPSPMNRSMSPISRRFQGRSISPMSRQSSIQSDLTMESRKKGAKEELLNGSSERQMEARKNSNHVEFKKNYYKNKIRKKYNIRDYQIDRNDGDSSRRSRSIVSNESESQEEQLVTADKKYREMRRSLHKRTAGATSTSSGETPMKEITTVNHPKESLVVYHVEDPDLKHSSYEEGDIDDQYLDELRKSWYQKRGLALADSNSSEENRAEC
eukprot:CAMPEP_0116132330 /NCGR_PEP_ID=MMETSP0329-20121206/9487_1 /TAXON_ID=697910 /ORGANISM="Pseudo-nitzschia arenysensis, Strain B593" /LENGTH=632 /DNA_ID=CAMNT_0003626831 /DNA_START=114 /DNA_END=2012 /DNA_ORIENTATION=-